MRKYTLPSKLESDFRKVYSDDAIDALGYIYTALSRPSQFYPDKAARSYADKIIRFFLEDGVAEAIEKYREEAKRYSIIHVFNMLKTDREGVKKALVFLGSDEAINTVKRYSGRKAGFVATALLNIAKVDIQKAKKFSKSLREKKFIRKMEEYTEGQAQATCYKFSCIAEKDPETAHAVAEFIDEPHFEDFEKLLSDVIVIPKNQYVEYFGKRKRIKNSIEEVDSILNDIDINGLDLGSEELLRLVLYSDRDLDYAKNYVIPSLRIAVGMHRDKYHPIIGTEFGTVVESSDMQPKLAEYLFRRMEETKQKHSITKTSIHQNIFEIRTLPSYYPVLSLLVDNMIDMFPKGKYMYHTSIEGSIYRDSIFALACSLVADCPELVLNNIKTDPNRDGMGFPGIYIGMTGTEAKSQTSIVDGILIPGHSDLVSRNYRTNFIRKGLLGAAVSSKDMKGSYRELRASFRKGLLRSGLSENEATIAMGSNYGGKNHPFENKWIQEAVKLLRKAGEKDNFRELASIVDSGIYGTPEKNGLLQAAYNNVERMFIGTLLKGRFRDCIVGLEQAGRNADYKEAVEKLLAYI